mmetsp:Transcript_6944/g.6114  ORF Transcript_6944/g.6114 Transcript_6944/m.6114 type:complete len:154 (+) Transcript_6944:379-840(+)
MQCDGIPIDISFNQIGGILSFKYLEEVDKEIGKDHLFKKAILILKAWCMYKGRVLGSNIGCFSSYTLEVLIVHLILTHDIKTPIDVFLKLFEYDWSQNAVTIFGLSKIEDSRNDPEILQNSYYFEEEDCDEIERIKIAHFKIAKKYQEEFKIM